MLNKIWTIFKRDVKVNFREVMPLYIMLAPLMLAIGINLITPGINDTTVNIALIEGENPAQEQCLNEFAHVETFPGEAEVLSRVKERDSLIGILPGDNGYYILAQGNEPESVVEYAKLLNVFFESGVDIENSKASIVEFGETVPPVKKMLVNILLLMIPMLSGMLITLNIVEEKADKTISAINLSPTSRTAFILGKSLTGMMISLVTTVVCILITGFYNVNILLLLLVAAASTVLAMTIGFIQGINNDDVMEAVGSMKLVFLPLAGSVAGYELLSGGWQAFFWWSPFYWSYRANNIILGKEGSAGELLLYTAIIAAICITAYALMLPRIKKGLQ
ncbi:MAG: ABC-2 family transporter protein [Firmicutes bacterium ADurb.Bin182]|nr:MAG: ABC-2 family transporter protein [Firmicutes bacterium ADurb.Bin182]